MTYARDFHSFRSIDEVLSSPQKVREMSRGLEKGDCFRFKNVFPEELITRIKNYLAAVGRNSLPNYHRIESGAPNFHRINRSDPRAYVEGCFHQFCFFPWNQDVFDFFELFKKIYHLKNVASGLPADQFLGSIPQDGRTARIAFQQYPRGGGYLNRHIDQVEERPYCVPIMLMSQRGVDFREGGVFVETSEGAPVYLEDETCLGDVLYFSSQLVHGVKPIDPSHPMDWLSYQGRWMALFNVNRLADHLLDHQGGNSVDLEK